MGRWVQVAPPPYLDIPQDITSLTVFSGKIYAGLNYDYMRKI